MLQTRKDLLRRLALAFGAIVLLAAFSQRALQNLARIDYRNSNFVFFWFAGRMVVAGQNPYDGAEWLAQHELNHVTWRADRVFSYPLPLAVFLAPLGVLPLDAAYVAWQLLSLAVLSASVWVVLRSSASPQPQRLFFPLVVALLFFGPVYLTLQIGALGAFTLGALTGAILALERRRELLAGALLSLVLLKPSQGLPILLLGGCWLVLSRSWKALLGMAFGALGLLVIGLVLDPAWPAVFLASAQGLIARNLGAHSNVFSLASHACASSDACTWGLGGAAALLVAGAALIYMQSRRRTLNHFEAFSLIIPVAFIVSFYAWSYDQFLYVIPIAWITGQLSAKVRGYILAISFALLLVALSIVVLAVHAYTGTDVLSSVTSFLVLAGLAVVWSERAPRPPKEVTDRPQIGPHSLP